MSNKKFGSMIDWSQFIAATPELASFGKKRLESRIAYLATIRLDGEPASAWPFCRLPKASQGMPR